MPQVQLLDRVVNVHVEVVSVPETTEETVDVIQSMPQERIMERIVENTNVPVPSVKEEIIKVAKHGLTDTMKEKNGSARDLSDEVEKLKSQLSDGENTLPADKEPASNLDGSCASQAPEWEERQRFFAEELVTIHDTTKLLNDYDSIELPMEILPSPSLMQLQSEKRGVARRARAVFEKIIRVTR